MKKFFLMLCLLQTACSSVDSVHVFDESEAQKVAQRFCARPFETAAARPPQGERVSVRPEEAHAVRRLEGRFAKIIF